MEETHYYKVFEVTEVDKLSSLHTMYIGADSEDELREKLNDILAELRTEEETVETIYPYDDNIMGNDVSFFEDVEVETSFPQIAELEHMYTDIPYTVLYEEYSIS